MSKWQWIFRQLGNRLWLRSSMFCLLAVATALFALVVKDYIPDGVSRKIGADAVGKILEIIANSMLVVTTFSLSTMVAAFSAATANVTPRATQLLLNDRTTQNTLSIFIGAFLFSLVSIIALSMGVYGESGRLVLFVVTLVVIALIVGVLLRWMSYLSTLGRVKETIDMVEKVTSQALAERIDSPFLGGVELKKYNPKSSHYPVHLGKIGYIEYIDVGALSKLAEEANATFYLQDVPGAFNNGNDPVLYSTVHLDEEKVMDVSGLFSIGDSRSFEQDPRFGLIVLSEIASRALSPAVNDAGTAIDILGTSARILAPWVERAAPDIEPIYKNIHVPSLNLTDLFEDIFMPIARDGASNMQVGILMQKALLSLSQKGDKEVKDVVAKMSKIAMDYADKKLVLPEEKERVKSLSVECIKLAKK